VESRGVGDREWSVLAPLVETPPKVTTAQIANMDAVTRTWTLVDAITFMLFIYLNGMGITLSLKGVPEKVLTIRIVEPGVSRRRD